MKCIDTFFLVAFLCSRIYGCDDKIYISLIPLSLFYMIQFSNKSIKWSPHIGNRPYYLIYYYTNGYLAKDVKSANITACISDINKEFFFNLYY